MAAGPGVASRAGLQDALGHCARPEKAAKALQAISDRHVLTHHTPHQLLELLVTRYGMNDVADILSPVLDDLPRN